MTPSTDFYHDLIPRSQHTRLRELTDDLAALWSENPAEVDRWMSRPSILRRVAGELAARLAPDTDRVIALGAGAHVLGCAVSLVTGLPFCAIDDDGVVFGNYHTSENVALISVDGGVEDPRWISTLEVSRRLSVIARHRSKMDSEMLISRLPLRHDDASPEMKEKCHG